MFRDMLLRLAIFWLDAGSNHLHEELSCEVEVLPHRLDSERTVLLAYV